MYVADSGTWSNIAETRGKESGWEIVEDWSTDNREERKITNTETI